MHNLNIRTLHLFGSLVKTMVFILIYIYILLIYSRLV